MLMKYRLFTPGPTSVPEATLLELAKPVHHHRTGEFRAMFNEIQTLLQYVYQTRQQVHTITGSGTTAFEAGFTSVGSPGAKVLSVRNGRLAEGWARYGRALGGEGEQLRRPSGGHAAAQQR